MRHCPENTLSAFQRAVRDGADAVETDIRCTADGAFVCIHDGTLDRTTDGSGRVGAMTLKGIRQLNAARAWPGHPAERIPTIEELVRETPGEVGLALELKDERFDDPSVGVALAGRLEALGALERTLVLSFRRARLRHFVEGAPRVPAGLAVMLRPVPPPSPGLLGPWWPLLLVNPNYIRMAHGRGQMVCPLDPRPDRRLRRYLRLDADAVLTDDPAATRQTLDRLRSETRGGDHPTV
jgi:glycerophosphoryl diester phosphodiesterase